MGGREGTGNTLALAFAVHAEPGLEYALQSEDFGIPDNGEIFLKGLLKTEILLIPDNTQTQTK